MENLGIDGEMGYPKLQVNLKVKRNMGRSIGGYDREHIHEHEQGARAWA
jgi:hypothetical protein